MRTPLLLLILLLAPAALGQTSLGQWWPQSRYLWPAHGQDWIVRNGLEELYFMHAEKQPGRSLVATQMTQSDTLSYWHNLRTCARVPTLKGLAPAVFDSAYRDTLLPFRFPGRSPAAAQASGLVDSLLRRSGVFPLPHLLSVARDSTKKLYYSQAWLWTTEDDTLLWSCPINPQRSYPGRITTFGWNARTRQALSDGWWDIWLSAGGVDQRPWLEGAIEDSLALLRQTHPEEAAQRIVALRLAADFLQAFEQVLHIRLSAIVSEPSFWVQQARRTGEGDELIVYSQRPQMVVLHSGYGWYDEEPRRLRRPLRLRAGINRLVEPALGHYADYQLWKPATQEIDAVYVD